MTNEEILKQQKIVKYIPYFIKAMDAAREDEAKGFVKWLGGNYDLSDFVSGRIYEG